MIKKGLCIRIYLAEICKNDSRVIVSQIHHAAYVIYLKVYGAGWKLQFNFTIIQLAYFVMDKWTNRPAMLFDIYLQGKWIGFKIDNFLTLNCNFTLVFFQDYYFISTSRPGMLTSLEGGYCAKNNMKVNSHEKYSSYQILGGLLWQIHQTHIPLKVVLLIHMKCFGFRKVCQN